MRIGVIGSGNIGGTLARLFAGVGHEVAISNSRGPDSLGDLVADIGQAATAATVAEAAAFGKVVVVAVPVKAYDTVAGVDLDGKVVIDTTNYYPQRDGRVAELDAGATTSSALLASRLPAARVVKAFNTIRSGDLAGRGAPDAAHQDRFAIPVAADDAGARSTVFTLIDAIGFAPVDAGGLDESWRQEPGAPVYAARVGPDEASGLLSGARR